MARGVRRQQIFSEEVDYQLFLLTIKKVQKETGFRIHAYCLMTNHIHLLIETKDTDIGEIMRKLLGHYAMTYNHRHGYRGHLFEGRFKSCLVKDDRYFLQTSRYIHLNPVKARMVAAPEEYKWSSYRTILRMTDDGITDSIRTLDYFKDRNVIRYREFVDDIGHKYCVDEEEIHMSMEEDEVWLPW